MADIERFEEFYRGTVGRLIGVLFPVTGDLHEAEELAQEAYASLGPLSPAAGLRRPEAWVRRVAMNLAADRGRRLQRQARALLRTGPPAAVPPASAEAVALAEVLRTLPMHQRQAIVLHHLVDLPIEEVAAILGTRAGTVKSWLARGRRNLAARLGEPEEVLS